jgi:hypothetical protein
MDNTPKKKSLQNGAGRLAQLLLSYSGGQIIANRLQKVVKVRPVRD